MAGPDIDVYPSAKKMKSREPVPLFPKSLSNPFEPPLNLKLANPIQNNIGKTFQSLPPSTSVVISKVGSGQPNRLVSSSMKSKQVTQSTAVIVPPSASSSKSVPLGLMALDEIKRQHERKTELQKMQRKIASASSSQSVPLGLMTLDEIKRQHESKTEFQKMQRKIAPQGSTSTAPNTGNRISLGTKYDNLDSKSTEAQKSELRAKLFKESGGSLPSSSVYSQGSSTLQSKAGMYIILPNVLLFLFQNIHRLENYLSFQ